MAPLFPPDIPIPCCKLKACNIIAQSMAGSRNLKSRVQELPEVPQGRLQPSVSTPLWGRLHHSRSCHKHLESSKQNAHQLSQHSLPFCAGVSPPLSPTPIRDARGYLRVQKRGTHLLLPLSSADPGVGEPRAVLTPLQPGASVCGSMECQAWLGTATVTGGSPLPVPVPGPWETLKGWAGSRSA